MSQERFSGDLMLSSIKFQTHDIKQFARQLDSGTMPGYPLREVGLGLEKFQHKFYRRWLQMTERFGGNEHDIMAKDEYLDSNLMTFDILITLL